MEAFPEAELKVYAIWFDVLAGDDRSKWDPTLLNDARVTELWDADGELGNWFPRQDEYSDIVHGPLAWDIFFLYGGDATWDRVPQPLVESGSTVIGSREKLRESILPLIDKQ